MRAQLVRGGARLVDVRADAVLTVNDGEHQRRRQQKLGAVTELSLLHSLSQLPHGLPVFFDALPQCDQRRVVRAPYSMVDFVADGVVREIVPAVDVTGVQVRSGLWPARLQRAAAFARFAPTVAVMGRPPTSEQQLQADYFGVGLVQDELAAEGGTGDIYLPPVAPRVSFAPVQWLFREHAYCAWLAENEAAAAQRGALVDLVEATYNRLVDEHDLYSADASTENDVDAAQGAYDAAYQALETFDAAYAAPPVEQAETCDTDEL